LGGAAGRFNGPGRRHGRDLGASRLRRVAGAPGRLFRVTRPAAFLVFWILRRYKRATAANEHLWHPWRPPRQSNQSNGSRHSVLALRLERRGYIMATVNVIKAASRSRGGKGAARSERRAGRVPGIIYGDGKPPLPISLDYNELRQRIFAGHFLTTVH